MDVRVSGFLGGRRVAQRVTLDGRGATVPETGCAVVSASVGSGRAGMAGATQSEGLKDQRRC